MAYLEYPSQETWEEREQLFESVATAAEANGSYLVSEQACALIGEVQMAYCAGAWIAVIVLAMSVVDAQLRETELSGFSGNTKALLSAAQANQKLQVLRKRRNAILHLDPDRPAITVDQQWENRKELQAEATEALELMFEAFFMSPGT